MSQIYLNSIDCFCHRKTSDEVKLVFQWRNLNLPGQKVLLLNASNMDAFPVYPYAFIQIPALARQVGIDVVCKDLLGIPQEKWKQTLQALIEQHDPVMILVTLQNTDSLVVQDYAPDGLKKGKGSTYFPIERTRELVTAIREISDLKITVGRFNFSLLPNELMDYLHPDFGVLDGPDDYFAHLEEIQNGNPGRVENLLYFQEGRLVTNPRIFTLRWLTPSIAHR
jgi:hypothetical protein